MKTKKQAKKPPTKAQVEEARRIIKGRADPFANQPPAPPAKKLPPPPPAKVPPPPPPKKPTIEDFPANSVLHGLPKRPPAATVIQWESEPDPKSGQVTTVVIPFNCYGDFSSYKTGRVTWGRLRYDDEFIPCEPDNGVDPVPASERITPATANVGATEADLPPRVTKPAQKREGVCAFIDALIMAGGKTAEAIRDLTLAQFPGRDAAATLATVRTRPSHIKAKGQVPPPFKKS